MVLYIKKGKEASDTAETREQIETTVREIIWNADENDDTALRKYAEQFDHWSPECFRLTDAEIQAGVNAVPRSVREDILFAQEQIRNFARHQRASITDIEVETLPGVTLGHKNIPVESAGCYIPGEGIPWWPRPI